MELTPIICSAFVESSVDAIVVLDEEGRILSFNPAAENMFGYQCREIIGKFLNAILPASYPSNQELAMVYGPKSATQSVGVSQALGLKKHGRAFPVEISFSEIRQDNMRVFFSVIRDLTTRSINMKPQPLSDDNYQMLAANVLDMISHHDVHGTYLYVSPACKSLLGYEASEMLGRNAYEFFHPDDLEAISQSHRSILALPDVDTVTYRIRQKSGAYLWFETVSKTMRDKTRGLPMEIVAVSRDITARKTAEEALEKSERHFQILFETMNKGVLHYDIDGKIISANPAAESILGLSLEQMRECCSHGFPSLAIGDDGKKIPREALPSVAAFDSGQSVTDVEMGVYNPKEKRYRWTIVNAIPVLSNTGATEIVFTTFTDITERKIIEQALKESEQRLRLILEQVNAYIWAVDRNLTINYVAGAGTINALAFPTDVVEKRMDLYHFYNTDSPDYEPIRAHLQSLNGKTITYELEYQGMRFHAQTSPLRNTSDDIIGCIGVAVDITDSRRAEKALIESEMRYRQIVETAEEGIWLIDENSNTVFANKKMAEMLNHSVEEMQGKSLFEFMDAEAVKVAETNVEKRKKGIAEKHEFVFLRKNGGSVMTRMCTNPLFDDDGNYKGSLAMVTDITQEIESAAEREKLQHQLQQAQKLEAIGLLTGGIAHDFNNILGSVLGYTSLALDRFVPDKNSKLAKYLNEVLIAGNRARDLVLQMLTYSRGNDGKRQKLSLVPLIKESIKMLRATLPATVEIRQYYAADLPDALVDPIQIQQVFTNLCINARDAMQSKGVLDISLRTVNVTMEQCASCHNNFSGDYLELGVTDNGSGLHQDILHKIFDPFFSTKEIGKGSGMGLPVVHGIMHGYDGHILLKTKPGVGTTFRLLIPLV